MLNPPGSAAVYNRWRADQCVVTDSVEGAAGHRLAADRADVRPQMGWRRDRVGGGGRRGSHVRRPRGHPRGGG